LVLVVQSSRLSCASPPFPTRRSSDLLGPRNGSAGSSDRRCSRSDRPGTHRGSRIDRPVRRVEAARGHLEFGQPAQQRLASTGTQDRKSTRLNSSHVKNSYAVFCLKKK